MNTEQFARHGAKHSRDLAGLHGGMRPEGRQDCLQMVSVIFPRVSRQVAGAGMNAALVRWHNQYAVSLPELCEAPAQQAWQLRKQIAVDIAGGAVKTHSANSTFFSPGASAYRKIRAIRYAPEAIAKRLT